MENKKIIEWNKLIAEFMEVKNFREYELNSKHKCLIISDDDGFIDYVEGINFLSYNNNWNRLMPVVEKICRMEIGDGIEYVEYPFLRTFGMLNNHKCSSHKTEEPDGKIMVRLNGFSVFKSDSLIEATFLSVVEFIKWYNENKNN